jgi:hypothetical protein
MMLDDCSQFAPYLPPFRPPLRGISRLSLKQVEDDSTFYNITEKDYTLLKRSQSSCGTHLAQEDLQK